MTTDEDISNLGGTNENAYGAYRTMILVLKGDFGIRTNDPLDFSKETYNDNGNMQTQIFFEGFRKSICIINGKYPSKSTGELNNTSLISILK